MAKAINELVVSELQKKTTQSVVNIFETGSALGDYSQVTLLAGDPGHLTYGRSQTTLASGNLFLLIKAYCDAPDAAFGEPLRRYQDGLAACDVSLDNDVTLRRLLREAGDDAVMRTTQDAFFDRVYWAPALASARSFGFTKALSNAVVYDSTVHGAWKIVRDLTVQTHGSMVQLGETAWLQRYIETRRAWLAHHPKPILHGTVYRMDAFGKMIDERKWSMELPLTVRGIRIDESTFAQPVRASAAEVTERLLKLETPYMVGEDVRAAQTALSAKGFPGESDGIYGPLTEARIRQFQLGKGLTADGIVGPATRVALGL